MNTSTPEQASKPPRSGVVPAWLVFGVVSVFEYLAVSYSVDARDLLAPAGLESILGRIGEFVPLAFIFVASVIVMGGATIRLRLRGLSVCRPERTWTFAGGIANMLLTIGVVALALRIRTFDGTPVPVARAYLALWFATVVAAQVALLVSLFSPKMLVTALRGLRREIGIGLLVAIVAWGAGQLGRLLWEPLASLTLECVHALLTVIAKDPVASIERAVVGTSRFYVTIAPVCSGVEGIGLMLTFIGAFLYIQRLELAWPRSFWLLPLSALLVWLLNVVRVTALIAVGTWYSPEVALGGFHSKAGWVFFTFAALGTVLVVQRSRTFRRDARQQGPTRIESKHDGVQVTRESREATVERTRTTAAYLVPMLSVLAAKLLGGLLTSGFDYFYPLSVLAALVALWRFRRLYPPVRIGSLWLPLGVGAAVAVVWLAGFQRGSTPSALPAGLETLSPTLGAMWLAVRVFGTVVTVPIVEELAFRGYVLRRFVSPDFNTVEYRNLSWLGLLISSVTFGLLHSQWGLGTIAGFAFGLIVVARGRLSDAVLAHAIANAGIAAYALLSRDWALLG